MLIHGPAGIGKSLAAATVIKKISDQLMQSEGAELLVERLTPADLVNVKD